MCSTACILTSPTRTSTSNELARARWTVMKLFVMDRHQLQQAAALVIMLDNHPFRHTSTARSRWPASSRRAAAAARRSARGPHAPRSSPRTRIAATSATSEKTNGIREANTAGIYLSIYLSLLKEITAHPLFIMAPGFPEVRGDRVRKALARFMPLRPSRWLVIVCACRTKALHFTPTSFGGRATSRAVCIAGPSYGGAGGSDLIEPEAEPNPDPNPDPDPHPHP